jgi:hypothetical protein
MSDCKHKNKFSKFDMADMIDFGKKLRSYHCMNIDYDLIFLEWLEAKNNE